MEVRVEILKFIIICDVMRLSIGLSKSYCFSTFQVKAYEPGIVRKFVLRISEPKVVPLARLFIRSMFNLSHCNSSEPYLVCSETSANNDQIDALFTLLLQANLQVP